jgi:hypothetical protein
MDPWYEPAPKRCGFWSAITVPNHPNDEFIERHLLNGLSDPVSYERDRPVAYRGSLWLFKTEEYILEDK